MATNKTSLVECLENTLRFWEDISFFGEARVAYEKARNIDLNGSAGGAFARNWRDYRRFVLAGDVHAVQAMVPVTQEERRLSAYQGGIPSFPEDLMLWCHSSRRVFHLSSDLELLLANTSLGDMTWSDIELPFPSFLLSLENGLSAQTTNMETVRCKKILVTTKHGRGLFGNDWPVMQIMLFPDGCWENYQLLSDMQRDRLMKQATKGKDSLLTSVIAQINTEFKTRRSPASCSVFGISIANLKQRKATVRPSALDWADPISKNRMGNSGDMELNDKVSSLVASLCLYLQTLTPQQKAEHVTSRKEQRVTGKSPLTQEADICTVSSIYTLTADERVSFAREVKISQNSHEISCHFRRGTWRRKPGTGDDPNAPRCVWQRPTIVRMDKLQEGSLPLGAQTNMR